MNPSELYELDFVAWTEQQAAALRSVVGISNTLDLPNLAEEIESLGRRDVREVESLIRQIFLHLLKIVSYPSSDAQVHWRIEIVAFQADAVGAFAPSMVQKIDVDRLWQRTCQAFLVESATAGLTASELEDAASHSPVSLHDLLANDFAVGPILERLRARITPRPPAA